MIKSIQKWLPYPKIELHNHLDTAISYNALRRLSPSLRLKEYREKFISPYTKDLSECLKCIDHALVLMQTEEALTIAVDDMVDQFAAENILYGEIRFAPLLHTNGGLKPEAIVEVTLKAMHDAAKYYNVHCGLILCTLRHFSEEQSIRTARLVERFAKDGVVALDLAADEAGFPLDNHISAFEKIRTSGLNAIAHSGEGKGAGSVRDSIENLNVTRIGHGVRSVEDMSVVELIKERKIHLEICVTSNIKTNVFPNLADHTINQLKELGVSIGINTDGGTLIGTTMSTEYAVLEQNFGWNIKDFRTANLNALAASFAPAKVKSALAKKIIEAYTDDW
ncbi:adenosine deaminase [Paremcibacter congregatus]|uniref:adenosine deaminase n=1 Tax=Paremcibacter congregatus TaxID=2043170 RepID=A0A2G4YNJ7_9PROT|nr:adenosine deaminase [Paremcibacter congregatus]PHZ83892.1 adenosine deaminase [Paremcibacter congregatus]QDE27596.1 adenosine deaminase [Paremcibacter congregatus]